MSLQVLDQPTAAPARTKPGRRPRIPPRIAEAVRLLTTGECKTQRAAAERTGLNVSYLCEALKKPNVQVFIDHEARKTIAAGKMRASARLIELIDASSEHVSLDATKHTLAIEGIKPPETGANININNSISVGYVIDIAPQQASTRTIEHEAQNDAT
jgi:hypothetical protein